MSQPVVSHAVKDLERRLGVRLFERGPRSVALTPEGKWFSSSVARGLRHIYQSALHLHRSHGLDAQVTLSVSTALAAHWLLPRVAGFRARHPDIDLRFQTTDKDVDLVAEGISIGIRLGHGDWPEYRAWRFADEEVYAVCSADARARNGGWSEPCELLDKTLIHLEEPYRRRISWKDWFRHFGIDYELPTHGLQLNDYAVVLQAAIAGQGIALGWRHLVSHLLRSGQLRRAVKHSYRSAKAFYVVTPKVWPVNEATQLFRDWMIAEARRDKLSGEEEGVAV